MFVCLGLRILVYSYSHWLQLKQCIQCCCIQKQVKVHVQNEFFFVYSSCVDTAWQQNKQLLKARHDNPVFDLSTHRYLLEQDVPGSRIGPEPTTDCFTAIMHGDVEGLIPGNALIVDPNKPFRKLNPFGNTFLNRWIDW